jgi:membrane-bound lytic murein transglycosylase B
LDVEANNRISISRIKLSKAFWRFERASTNQTPTFQQFQTWKLCPIEETRVHTFVAAAKTEFCQVSLSTNQAIGRTTDEEPMADCSRNQSVWQLSKKLMTSHISEVTTKISQQHGKTFNRIRKRLDVLQKRWTLRELLEKQNVVSNVQKRMDVF